MVRFTGGALFGLDRDMNDIAFPHVYIALCFRQPIPKSEDIQ
ncbi:hypothetical protein Z949_696 [Sulfitobacter guttiformis KCTC 32187]|nr:hypothetical protein Z949_696 [Sulfitobacter guttiformis KCTC 32187]